MANDKELPPLRYTNFLNHVVDKLQKNLKNSSQLVSVAFLINDENQKIEIIPLTFKDDAEKDYAVEIIKQRASKWKADAICMLSEGWALPTKYQNPEDTNRILNEYGQISNFPEKVDIVFLNLETREGLWTGIGHIKPAKKGRKISGFAWKKVSGMEGRFSNMLPVKYPTPTEVDNFVLKFREKFRKAGIDPDKIMQTKSAAQIVDALARQSPVEALNEDMIDYLIEKIKNGEDDENEDENHGPTP